MPENDRLAIFWQVPAAAPAAGADGSAYAHLRQVAMAADRLGFDGLLLPSGTQSEEAWTYAAAIAPFTERLRFLIPVRPGGLAVAAASRLAASLDRITDGRVLLHLETRAAAGEAVDPELAFFLAEWRRHTDLGGLEPGHRRLPALWLPEAALAFTQARAEQGETCVISASSSEQVRTTVTLARARAAAAGRLVRFAVRLHLVLRPTDEAAAEAARALRAPEVAQEVGPILAGSPGLVAARLMEFRAAGVDAVIAAGTPPLEEAYRVAELLLPLLPAQAPAPAPRLAGGFSLSELRAAAL
jgi:alkanesulfonate monooxygenase